MFWRHAPFWRPGMSPANPARAAALALLPPPQKKNVQGTILDRIDYNMEQVVEKVEDGVVQLQQAEEYQKSARPRWCIAVLLFLIAAMLTALILKHQDNSDDSGGSSGGGGNDGVGDDGGSDDGGSGRRFLRGTAWAIV